MPFMSEEMLSSLSVSAGVTCKHKCKGILQQLRAGSFGESALIPATLGELVVAKALCKALFRDIRDTSVGLLVTPLRN